MKKIITQKGQSIVDLAIQEFGSAEGVIEILLRNPQLSQDAEVNVGVELQVSGKVLNEEVLGYIKSEKKIVSTATQFEDKLGYSESGYVETGYAIKI